MQYINIGKYSSAQLACILDITRTLSSVSPVCLIIVNTELKTVCCSENIICCLTFEPCQRFSHLPQSDRSLLHVLQGHYSVCCCRVFLQRDYILLQLTADTNKMHKGKYKGFRVEKRESNFATIIG